ncbi:GntR family transcriptional regulator [Xanthomonas campestris]|uniref:GntR family transcriptional regulator n=1 Tax=Xanthomonas campestris TaxID=339 RepID=UPI003CCFF3EF
MRRRTHELVPALGAFIRRRGANSRNLAQALRAAIAAGELKAGDRLPSSRTLASSLGFAGAPWWRPTTSSRRKAGWKPVPVPERASA